MKNIVDVLESVSVKKHVVTSIEYECESEKQEDAVFESVRNLVTEHLDDFAKITFDIDQAEHKVKVEVIQNA
ncbi:MAG: hypothetical protein HUJ53_07075 [Holdemanella sp.]|nr:hypothetical protein [Holdemanella sp.]